MSELVADCPRCGTKKITFSLTRAAPTGSHHARWQKTYEAFCTCRHCFRSTIFLVVASNINYQDLFSDGDKLVGVKGAVNNFMDVSGYVSLKDTVSELPPEFLPKIVEAVFREAVTCKAVQCFNASATMLRLCLDLATREKLPPIIPEQDPTPNYRTRRDLGLRLPWLFDNKILPEDLRELSHAVKEDGNDGAHAGTITGIDVEDLLDFTRTLLERIYTEPARVKLARERRDARRNAPAA